MNTTLAAVGNYTTTSSLVLHEEWQYFLVVLSWFFLLVTTIICCYGTYAAILHIAKMKGSPSKKKVQTVLIGLTIICMWIFNAINFCDAVGLPHWTGLAGTVTDPDSFHSNNSYLMWNVFWCISKILLYLIYVGRVYSVFRGTKYESKNYVYFVIAFCLFVQVILLILWIWYYNLSWVCCGIWADDQYETCAIIAWLILVFDIAITSMVTILFIVSLRRLLAAISKFMLEEADSGRGTAGSLGMADLSTKEASNIASTTKTVDKEVLPSYVDGAPTGRNDQAPANPELKEEKSKTWGQRQQNLVKTATRLFVLAMVSLQSSIFYQLVFGIAINAQFSGTKTHRGLYYFTFTWSLDNTINVMCLFLSLSFAKKHYADYCCWCDGCCFSLIQKLTRID